MECMHACMHASCMHACIPHHQLLVSLLIQSRLLCIQIGYTPVTYTPFVTVVQVSYVVVVVVVSALSLSTTRFSWRVDGASLWTARRSRPPSAHLYRQGRKDRDRAQGQDRVTLSFFLLSFLLPASFLLLLVLYPPSYGLPLQVATFYPPFFFFFSFEIVLNSTQLNVQSVAI